MTPTQIQGQLATQNVVIATGIDPNSPGNGDIFVQSSISWSSNNSLTLSAFHSINIYDSSTPVTVANTAGGNLVLRADSTGAGNGGTVNFQPSEGPSGSVNFSSSTGSVSIYYNPTAQTVGTKYQNPTNFLCSTSSCAGVFVNQPSQLTAYMLVNSASDLQLVSTKSRRNVCAGQEL